MTSATTTQIIILNRYDTFPLFLPASQQYPYPYLTSPRLTLPSHQNPSVEWCMRTRLTAICRGLRSACFAYHSRIKPCHGCARLRSTTPTPLNGATKNQHHPRILSRKAAGPWTSHGLSCSRLHCDISDLIGCHSSTSTSSFTSPQFWK